MRTRHHIEFGKYHTQSSDSPGLRDREYIAERDGKAPVFNNTTLHIRMSRNKNPLDMYFFHYTIQYLNQFRKTIPRDISWRITKIRDTYTPE